MTYATASNRKIFPSNATVRFGVYRRNQKQIEALTYGRMTPFAECKKSVINRPTGEIARS